MWDYIRVQFSGDINLLAGMNEFNFKILIPCTGHEVGWVRLKSLGKICIAELHNEVNIFSR